MARRACDNLEPHQRGHSGNGPQNVTQVMIDNGSDCASMGHTLEDEYPTIVWTPCTSLCLDLLIANIGKIVLVDEIFTIKKNMVKFVPKRPKVLSIYQAHNSLKILKPSCTRFAYMFILLDRVVQV